MDQPQSSLDFVWIFIERIRIPAIGLARFPSLPPSFCGRPLSLRVGAVGVNVSPSCRMQRRRRHDSG